MMRIRWQRTQLCAENRVITERRLATSAMAFSRARLMGGAMR
jgi:hypothetical protein